ncbi:MAG: chromosome partitioning protein ParB [Deltaproteobacteria bacterium CG12_big_fil_rev_8_21_14_0_65_43_10]|nr:MAG: chromosome partitioning protein ParB [Deltaproteobacteria bacterium CG12_big_fil_rev_8_21_14_0_65_43_10]
MTKRKVLGKGLGALIPEINQYDDKDNYVYCNVEDIQPNKFQPRKGFDENRIEDLVVSIKEKGIIQPLIVRDVGDGYELIAGERRWRAAKRAGITEVPVIVKKASDTEVLELSLIENIQREDLSCLEEAEAYKRLTEEFTLTQEEVAKRVGKDRSTITNYLRLLKLPLEIRDGLSRDVVTMGHARAFLSLETPVKQREAYRQVLKRGLSVRQTEKMVRGLKKEKKNKPLERDKDIHLDSIKNELIKRFGTRVKIVARKGGRGKIEIEFCSLDDLDRIIETLKGD